jgi:hypothetical protein
MKRYLPYCSGTGILSRYLFFLLFQPVALEGQSQPGLYSPDQLFRGAQFSFELKWTSFADNRYIHENGFTHEVLTKRGFGYELGVHGQYYFNRNWSVGVGIMNGSKRNLNYIYVIDDPGVFEPYEDDPALKELLEEIWSDQAWSRTRLTANWSMPVYGAYHQYMQGNSRHRLDYRMGVALRYHRPLRLKDAGITFLYQGDSFGDFTATRIWWHDDRRLLIDIQPYFGYTFVLANHKAISFGLSANLAFARDRTGSKIEILEDTDFEETGRFKISNHYLAVNFAYIFTTPGKVSGRNKAGREKQR